MPTPFDADKLRRQGHDVNLGKFVASRPMTCGSLCIAPQKIPKTLSAWAIPPSIQDKLSHSTTLILNGTTGV